LPANDLFDLFNGMTDILAGYPVIIAIRSPIAGTPESDRVLARRHLLATQSHSLNKGLRIVRRRGKRLRDQRQNEKQWHDGAPV
jgi:hypothetical protein